MSYLRCLFLYLSICSHSFYALSLTSNLPRPHHSSGLLTAPRSAVLWWFKRASASSFYGQENDAMQKNGSANCWSTSVVPQCHSFILLFYCACPIFLVFPPSLLPPTSPPPLFPDLSFSAHCHQKHNFVHPVRKDICMLLDKN